ncbi:MAG TPA: FHA domain-containing protein [Aggregatilineales bacterium]|nr:FHA domain-containing protein [Aggregatilineales bacterium]
MTNQPNTCPKCGEPYELGQLTCSKCGTLLFNPSASTVHVKMDPALLRLRRQRLDDATATPMPEHSLTLQIRGMSERIDFTDGKEITLGRADLSALISTRFDLTPYGAHERGVSREHAILRFKDNQFTLTDLSSVNGTSVNTDKLEPNQPRVLNDKDEIRLGTLSIVVRFELHFEPEKPATGTPALDQTLKLDQKFVTQPLEKKPGMSASATATETDGIPRVKVEEDADVTLTKARRDPTRPRPPESPAAAANAASTPATTTSNPEPNSQSKPTNHT